MTNMVQDTRFGKMEHNMVDGVCSTCGENIYYLQAITSEREDARYMVVEPINGATDWYVESYHATYDQALAEAERLNVEDPMREHPYITMF